VLFDSAFENEKINFDITNFNSVINAGLTIFQIITLEGWSKLMYNYSDTYSYPTAALYFAFVIILGAFTTLNLVLAAIMHSYLQQETEMQEKEKLAREKQQKILSALGASSSGQDGDKVEVPSQFLDPQQEPKESSPRGQRLLAINEQLNRDLSII